MQESPYLQGGGNLIEKFQKLPFLESFDLKHTKNVLELSKIRRYQGGELITPEGSFDCWIYIILSGEVEVLKQGKEIAIFNHVGDTFGELSVIDGEARSASVHALKETVCLAVDASFLERVKPEDRVAFYSIFYRLFAEVITQRLRATSDELVQVKKELERERMKK